MLNNLASLDGDSALRRRLQYHTKPALLCIDEVGYLSYSTGMRIYYLKLFSGDIEKKSTLVTTNKPFSEWAEIFLLMLLVLFPWSTARYIIQKLSALRQAPSDSKKPPKNFTTETFTYST